MHGVDRFARRMHAAEFCQHAIVERLHAERDAVDAGRAIAAKARGFDAGRIGFERDLGVGRDAPVARDRVEDGADRRRLHQRRRAAAEEDRGNGAARHAGGGRSDLRCKGPHEARFIDCGAAHMAVEIAIRAFRQTKRPMNVNAELRRIAFSNRSVVGEVLISQDDQPRHAQPRHASASFKKARARCDRPWPFGGKPCFSSLGISPNVRACPSGKKIGS